MPALAACCNTAVAAAGMEFGGRDYVRERVFLLFLVPGLHQVYMSTNPMRRVRSCTTVEFCCSQAAVLLQTASLLRFLRSMHTLQGSLCMAAAAASGAA
jgi:hypothetical protein